MAAILTATSSHTRGPDNATITSKSPDLLSQAASTMKLLTCVTARDHIPSLDLTSTISSADVTVGADGLQAGDVLTYRDLIHAALMPSNNTAAYNIGRTVGQMILDKEGGTGDPISRFRTAMVAKGSALGWSGHIVGDTWGGNQSNRLSARMLTSLMRNVYLTDPWLFGVAGKSTHTLTVTGGRTTGIDITHSAIVTDLQEWQSAKTGTWGNVTHLVMAWKGAHGSTYFSAITNSNQAERYNDMRAVIDEVIAAMADRKRGVALLAG